MSKSTTKAEKLLELAGKSPVLRVSELRKIGIGSSTVAAAVEAGNLEQVSRGIYRGLNVKWDEHEQLSEVIARIPQAIVVLVSALNFHGIGSHQAYAVNLLLKQNAVKPRIDYPPIEVVRSSIPKAFTEGVSEHRLNGVDVRITDPARTVADCFKHRSKLGLELCLEALKELHQSGTTPAELLHYARMNRVENVMRPYLEVLV